jgi:PleD family two-component response regulator
LANSPASAVFIRVPPEHTEAATAFIKDDVRRRDIFGAYDQSHLVLLLPELPAAVACDRITGIIARLKEAGVSGITAGVAVSPAPGGKSIEDLMVEADEALVEARYLGKAAVVSSDLSPRRDPAQSGYTVLIADDDPDLTRIVDAQMRAAGYTPSLVFDGEQALAALDKSRPDVLVLDLMMPKRNGFEVLAKLNQREGPRPSVIVLSARGREDDVTRAFDLGANDYMTKPFSPQELLARVARLLR